MVPVMLKRPSFNGSDAQAANARGMSTFSSPRVVKKPTGTRHRRRINKFSMSSSAVTSWSYTET